ncbi:hypothetical protein [Microbulbifer magnicolonia]|uniref:hypothetical protein n=1 Tax=Microbulbifer magnicolonia TaxID=3109744 RepID=UPI002B417403|nr:hypothetical protein [Microbulbifer sp. GG15]
MKTQLYNEEFSSVKDTLLHSALLARMRLQASVVGLMGFIAFIILIGEWNNIGLVNWHLLAVAFPLHIVYKDRLSVIRAEMNYLREAGQRSFS